MPPPWLIIFAGEEQSATWWRDWSPKGIGWQCALWGWLRFTLGLMRKKESKMGPIVDGWFYYETTPAIAKEAGRYRYEFARIGTTLSATDSLIAAVAIAHGATLITNNLRHFPMPEIRLLPHN